VTERNKGLDGLRGCAASAVIFFHCLGAFMLVPPLSDARSVHDVVARLAVTIFNGETAVFVFFIMSGAVLMNSLQRQEGAAPALAFKFAAERFFRLFPALWVAVLICYAAMLSVGEAPTAWQLFANLTLYETPINGATWTLNAEAIGTVFILAGFFACRKFGIVGLLLVLVLVTAASRHMPPRDLFVYFRWSAVPFAIGMLIPTPVGRALAMKLPPAALWVALVGMIFARHVTAAHGTTMTNIAIVCAGVVVTMLFYNKAGAFGRLLSTAPAVFLGTISYSLYLLNVAFIIIAAKLLGPSQTITGALLEGAVIALLTIPIAWASYRWIELPGIRLGRELFRGAATRGARSDVALRAPGPGL
jgi:peptidoglycan/LPS O-acetylase OafA/YrhL